MQVIEGKFDKEEKASLKEMLQTVVDDIDDGVVGKFLVVLESEGAGEMFTSEEPDKTNMMLDMAKLGLLNFGMEEEEC